MQAVTPVGGAVTLISPAPGAGTNPFTPGEGVRDVDLVRDVMSTNEALLVETDVSALVMVTAGAVNASGTTITAGSPVALSGSITLINTGPETATVVVAVIGPVLGAVSTPTESSTPSDPSDPGPAGPSATPPPAGPTTPTTAPRPSTTTSITTTTVAIVDSDGDGLSDGQEANQLGTDPNDADTDGDGIDDGREINAIGSNPLSTDSDSDGLTDGLEIDHSCDPQDDDTDGDNLGDAFEANAGGSECSLDDTDGDGFDDGEEFSLGTDRRDPASHP